jgi:hypothetical protein
MCVIFGELGLVLAAVRQDDRFPSFRLYEDVRFVRFNGSDCGRRRLLRQAEGRQVTLAALQGR